jgi:autotransporter-associated beta strand protein
MKSLSPPVHIDLRSHHGRAAWLGAWLLLAAALPAAADTPTYYWDTDGNNPGAGYPLDGNWDSVTPNWSTDPTGSSPTFPYTNRANVYFAATGDPTWTDNGVGGYTVTIDGVIPVSDIQIEDGTCTIVATPPGYLDKDTPAIGVFNLGQIATINAPIASTAGTSNGITKYAWGTLVLGGTNTYLGPTTIEGGTLQLAGPQLIPNGSPLVLANGGTGGYVDTPATLATGGFSQTLGSLTVTGAYDNVTRTLDLGNGPGTLAFADSHLQNWNGIPLTIVNYSNGVSSLRFGTNRAGLTATQLSLIQFEIGAFPLSYYVPASINANGFVTPISPPILSVTPSGSTNWVITWSAISGQRYTLHYKANLTDSTWSDVGDVVTATGSTVTLTNSVGSSSHGFYWVEPLPPQPPS